MLHTIFQLLRNKLGTQEELKLKTGALNSRFLRKKKTFSE